MELFDDVKQALRITIDLEFDTEIQDLIDTAIAELKLAGLDASWLEPEYDPLIKRAIATYAKANFGYDNPEADRFQKSFEMLKNHLSLSVEYTSPKPAGDSDAS